MMTVSPLKISVSVSITVFIFMTTVSVSSALESWNIRIRRPWRSTRRRGSFTSFIPQARCHRFASISATVSFSCIDRRWWRFWPWRKIGHWWSKSEMFIRKTLPHRRVPNKALTKTTLDCYTDMLDHCSISHKGVYHL